MFTTDMHDKFFVFVYMEWSRAECFDEQETHDVVWALCGGGEL